MICGIKLRTLFYAALGFHLKYLISAIVSYLYRGYAEHSNDVHFKSIHAFPRKEEIREFHLLWLERHFFSFRSIALSSLRVTKI